MPANYNRKILDLKRWTPFPTPAPVASVAGALVISSRLAHQRQMYLTSASVAHLYYPGEDGFVQMLSPALLGTFGAGVCGTSTCVGPTGNATGGSANSLITNLTLARGLGPSEGAAGYQIQITGGPGAGDVRTIAWNTVGANGVITVSAPFSAVPTASTTYRLLTPRWYILNAGTVQAGSFRMYDFATNTWASLAITGLPANWGTDGKMIATPSYGDNGIAVTFASGNASAGGATSLTNGAKAWTVNQWSNYQIRITAGTGLGQIRKIASNTATALTVATGWTTVPDATSAYVIEGNDDDLYIMGNGAVTLYRYSISGNVTTTLAPVAARAAAPSTGMSGHWVFGVTEDARWAAESAIINGQRIYSFRGGNTGAMDYYDIALNTWVSGVVYAPGAETFFTGTKYVYAGNFLYIHKDATGRWFRYSFAQQSMIGIGTNVSPQGAAVAGDTAYDIVEPETGIRFLHMILNSSQVHMRCMLI